MNAKQSGHSRQTSAAKAGISRRTAQRIESGTHRPKRGRPRDWKTRQCPLEGHWEADLLPMLEREPRLMRICTTSGSPQVLVKICQNGDKSHRKDSGTLNPIAS